MKRCVFGAFFHRIRVMTIREDGAPDGTQQSFIPGGSAPSSNLTILLPLLA